jgi:hypothetical protein
VATLQTYNKDVDFNIKNDFNAIVKDIKANNYDVWKVINFTNGDQVLIFGGSHDDIGSTTFIFKNNARVRQAFHSVPYGSITYGDGTNCKYVLHQVFDHKCSGYKPDRVGKSDIDWKKIRSFTDIKQLINYIDKLDTLDTWFSNTNWAGYDFCITKG